MEIDRIKDLFFLISGEDVEVIEAERFALCEELCESAARSIKALIKAEQEENLAGYEEALNYAAAYMAFYNLLAIDEALTPESVTSGEMKVELGERSKKAKQLLDDKLSELTPILKSDVFFFGNTSEMTKGVV